MDAVFVHKRSKTRGGVVHRWRSAKSRLSRSVNKTLRDIASAFRPCSFRTCTPSLLSRLLCEHGTDVNEEREGRKEEERREKEGEKGNVGEIVPRGCVKLRRRKKRLYSNDE